MNLSIFSLKVGFLTPKVFRSFGSCATRPSASPGRTQTCSSSECFRVRIPSLTQAALAKTSIRSKTARFICKLDYFSGWLGLTSSRASEDAERHGSPAIYEVSESEAPQGSAVLTRRGKINVPARSKTRHPSQRMSWAFRFLRKQDPLIKGVLWNAHY